MKFIMKFPTRSRPSFFKNVFLSWHEKKSYKHELNWIVSADEDDITMKTSDISDFCKKYDIKICYGKSKTKIEACNANIPINDSWDIIMLISDDMVCEMQDWDDIISNDMIINFPELDGYLWYPDGFNNKINTLEIQGRKYFDLFKYLYNPLYSSIYCDNENTDISEILGKQKKFTTRIFTHRWCGRHNRDKLCKKNANPKIIAKDRFTYERRKKKNFELKMPLLQRKQLT